ncbi:unnamed protein product [Polarella glacialis]|nr:unnamed protein product [Polarella glacialis]
MFAMFHLMHDGVSDIELGQAGNSGKKPSDALFLLCVMPLQLCAATPEVQARLEFRRSTFFEQNTRDIHQDKLTGQSLIFMENGVVNKDVMVILRGGQDASRERPLWMNWYFFALCTVCLVSVPYRLYLFSRCQKTEWTVLKHFSHLPCSKWGREAPQQSRVRGTDSASRAFRAVPREAANYNNNNNNNGAWPAAAALIGASMGYGEPGELNLLAEAPKYWKNRDLNIPFDEKVRVSSSELEKFQALLDLTFVTKATRDRKGGKMPARLVVQQVVRIEDVNLWQRFLAKRSEFARGPRPVQLHQLPGSGRLKTAPMEPQANLPSCLQDVCPELNEAYLFHGSSPGGALGIGESGFDMSMAGSHVGSMFGAGAYFAEASSKSDEYASEDPSGVFSGKYALLLCRVLVGNAFYITESNIPQIDEALATRQYDAVLGDREAKIGTFREIVALDQAQIYPEYVVIYNRSY